MFFLLIVLLSLKKKQDVVTSQPITTNVLKNHENTELTSDQWDTNLPPSLPYPSKNDLVSPLKSSTTISSKDLNLALTEAVGEVARRVKIGNKFTDGLDLSLTMDWASELRPSMRKLRQAMDGLLKTARLMHSVQRLQQDMRRTSQTLSTMYRRDVCFSQAVSFDNILPYFSFINSLPALANGFGIGFNGKTLGNNHHRKLCTCVG